MPYNKRSCNKDDKGERDQGDEKLGKNRQGEKGDLG